MITFEKAYEIAKQLKPNIDGCTEYENGFVFGFSGDDDFIGGNHTPCVILKKDGRAVTMSYFVIDGTGEEIRDIEIK